VFDDASDMAAVAAGVSRFLAVESCGQCSPCKQDGLAIADMLGRLCRGVGTAPDLTGVPDRTRTVIRGARCFLAQQQQRVIDSILAAFPDHFRHHLDPDHPGTPPEPILPLTDISPGGTASVDLRQLDKQPDWSYGETWSGRAPVERLAEGGPERP
jgi:hypothetical protein